MRLNHLDHRDVGQQLVGDALKRDERPNEHGHRTRKFDPILSRHRNDRVQEGTHVELGEIGQAKLIDKLVEVRQKVRVINIARSPGRKAEQAVLETG